MLLLRSSAARDLNSSLVFDLCSEALEAYWLRYSCTLQNQKKSLRSLTLSWYALTRKYTIFFWSFLKAKVWTLVSAASVLNSTRMLAFDWPIMNLSLMAIPTDRGLPPNISRLLTVMYLVMMPFSALATAFAFGLWLMMSLFTSDSSSVRKQ